MAFWPLRLSCVFLANYVPKCQNELWSIWTYFFKYVQPGTTLKSNMKNHKLVVSANNHDSNQTSLCIFSTAVSATAVLIKSVQCKPYTDTNLPYVPLPPPPRKHTFSTHPPHWHLASWQSWSILNWGGDGTSPTV